VAHVLLSTSLRTVVAPTGVDHSRWPRAGTVRRGRAMASAHHPHHGPRARCRCAGRRCNRRAAGACPWPSSSTD